MAPAPSPALSHATSLWLPYALASGQPLTRVSVRPLAGAEELLLAEAAADRLAPVRAATALIGVCAHDATGPIGRDRAAALSLGDREVILRGIFAANFGDVADMQVACPACDVAIEVTINLAAMTAAVPANPGPVPTGADVEMAGDGGALAMRFAGQDDSAIAAADPNIECALRLDCPDCGHGFAAWLDAYATLAARASAGGGIFAQIDALARAYGWSEAEILQLPAARRARYCAMVAG